MMESNKEKMQALAETAKNESLDIDQRRAAFKLLCELRGYTYQYVPDDHLRFVIAAMVNAPDWMPRLPLRDIAEAVAEGRARRTASAIRKV